MSEIIANCQGQQSLMWFRHLPGSNSQGHSTPLQLRWIKLEQLWPLKSTSTQLTFLDIFSISWIISLLAISPEVMLQTVPGRVPSRNPFVPGCFALRRSTGWVQRVVWAKRWTRSEGFRLFRLPTGFREEMKNHSESKNVKETLKPSETNHWCHDH